MPMGLSLDLNFKIQFDNHHLMITIIRSTLWSRKTAEQPKTSKGQYFKIVRKLLRFSVVYNLKLKQGSLKKTMMAVYSGSFLHVSLLKSWV